MRKWIHRFNEYGLLGLFDLPRCGRPPDFDMAQVLKVAEVATTPPEKLNLPFKTWSLSRLRRHLIEQGTVPSICREEIRRLLKDQGITYQQARTWQESDDPEFEIKRDDITALYLTPPEDGMVLCLDQKGPIQIRTHYPGPGYARRGKPRCIPSEYVRHGVVYLFAALNPHTGEVWERCFTKCNRWTVIWFLGWLILQLPQNKTIHIILDNLSAHKAQDTLDWLKRRYGDRVVLHFTPTNASWLNLIEAWFSVVTQALIKNGSYESKRAFRAAVRAYTIYYNQECHPYRWGHKHQRQKRVFLIRQLRGGPLQGRAPAACVSASWLRRLAKVA